MFRNFITKYNNMKAIFDVSSLDTKLNWGSMAIEYLPDFKIHIANFQSSSEMEQNAKKDVFLHKATGFSMTYEVGDKNTELLVKEKLFDFFGVQQNLVFTLT